MDQDFHRFIKEHIELIQQKFSYALAHMPRGKSEADKAFMDGACFAYNDVLALLRSQLEDVIPNVEEEFGPIVLEEDPKKGGE